VLDNVLITTSAATTVPEPSGVALSMLGILGTGLYLYRRQVSRR
jgi:hypothetical protein